MTESTIVLSWSKSADTAKGSGPKRESPSGRKGRKACKTFLKGKCANPSCDYWHPPVCRATNVYSDALRLMDSPVKRRRKGVERISCLTEGVCTIGLCVPRLPSEKVYPAGSWKIGIEAHRQVLEGHDASRKHSGKQGSIAGNHSKLRTSGANSMGSKSRGENARRNPKTGAVRPQRRLGTGKVCL